MSEQVDRTAPTTDDAESRPETVSAEDTEALSKRESLESDSTHLDPGVSQESAPVIAETSELEQSDTAALVAATLSSRRLRWPWFLGGLILGGVAIFGITEFLDRRNDNNGEVEKEEVAVSTAAVESRDLLEEVDWSGTLAYGDLVQVSGSGGTVTSAAESGVNLSRGDIVAEVDEEPVVVLFGESPFWRPLVEGIEGPDVFLLETNLVALGFDPDETITIDDDFTSATEAMVERWQEDVGRTVTGTVELADVVVVSGPSVITTPAVVGANASGPLVAVSAQRRVVDVVATRPGIINNRAAIGSGLETGTVVYELDEIPVVALLEGLADSDPVVQVLTSTTFTNTELEQALADEGYDPDEEMTVDGAITNATTAAIERWQQATGLPVTGQADPDYYVEVPAGRTVESHAEGHRHVLVAGVSELDVTVVVAVADADEFTVGDQVSIELADESLVDGEVREIGAVEESADPSIDPTVTISIEVLSDEANLIEGSVTVKTIGESVEDAVAIPTRALVSLAEGGFAVNVVDDSGETKLVGVELGSFDDGYVEVTEGAVSVGDNLVVPE